MKGLGCFKFLLLVITMTALSSICDGRRRVRSKKISVSCRPRTMVRYKLTVHTAWTRRTFPKMYPTYRPPAHWSVVVGNTHNADFTMWRVGENATNGAKMFAETGDSEVLNQEISQGYTNVFDSFTAPAVKKGYGQTSAVFFADGLHTQLSFMMKLVPSPDWFIGLSGLDLCRRGRWRPQLHINLRPMDAGTDQGLTFTSPNWPNNPAEPISEITSSFPDHDAASFYYPDQKVLPRIAYIDMELVSEYRLRRTVKEIVPIPSTTMAPTRPVSTPGITRQEELTTTTSSVKTTTVSPTAMDSSTKTDNEELTSAIIEELMSLNESDVEANQMVSDMDNLKDLEKIRTEEASAVDDPAIVKEVSAISKKSLKGVKSEDQPTLRELRTSVSEPSVVEPTGSISAGSLDEAQFPDLVPSEEEVEREFDPADCIVTTWSEWSPCSQTCGFGKKEKTREVIRYPLDQGASCPPLKQEALCGSMRSCNWKHFSFLGGLGSKSPGRGGMRRRRRKHRRAG